MTIAEVIAMVGLMVSVIAVVFNGIQTRRSAEFLRLNIVQAERTAESLLLDQQLARGNAVIHFTARFFDLLKDGKGKDLQEIINDPNWAYQFVSPTAVGWVDPGRNPAIPRMSEAIGRNGMLGLAAGVDPTRDWQAGCQIFLLYAPSIC